MQSRVTLTLSSMCIICCMSFSAFYHQFACCSEWHAQKLLQVDMAGIGIMIFGLCLICVWLGFTEFPVSQICCCVMMLLMAAGMVFLNVAPCTKDPHSQYLMKIAYYCLTIAVCISLAIYWFFGIASTFEQQHFTLKIVFGFVYLGLGFIFFQTNFPESKTTNRLVQLLLPSHFFWHIFVVMNGLCFYYLGYDYCKHIEQIY